MKKILIILSLLLLTGCTQESVLECVKTEELDNYKTISKELITFNNDNVLEYDASIEVVLDKDYIKYKSIFIKEIENNFKKYNKMNGVKFNSDETNNGINMTINADVSKMDDKSIKELKLAKKANIDMTKQEREKDGFKCK